MDRHATVFLILVFMLLGFVRKVVDNILDEEVEEAAVGPDHGSSTDSDL